jgi:hypothetical protein
MPADMPAHMPGMHADYVLNKQQGLVIRPYRRAHLTRGTDRELLYLSAYLAKIAQLETLEGLAHRQVSGAGSLPGALSHCGGAGTRSSQMDSARAAA